MTCEFDPAHLAAAILAGKAVAPEAFNISVSNVRKVADRIDSLVSPDPSKPRFMRGNIPAGWIRLLEIAVTACCWRAGQEAGAILKLIQCKEKFGELRVMFDVQGTPKLEVDIAAITTWTRTTSIGICALYGTPGRLTTDGWIIPLSAEAITLRHRDLHEFRRQSRVPSRA